MCNNAIKPKSCICKNLTFWMVGSTAATSMSERVLWYRHSKHRFFTIWITVFHHSIPNIFKGKAKVRLWKVTALGSHICQVLQSISIFQIACQVHNYTIFITNQKEQFTKNENFVITTAQGPKQFNEWWFTIVTGMSICWWQRWRHHKEPCTFS